MPSLTKKKIEEVFKSKDRRSLYNTSNHNDQLKLGASRPEEAVRRIQSFHEASLKGVPDGGDDVVGCSKRRWQSFSTILSDSPK
ncbi:hypothetical protein DEO72_LG5g1290 [Vigna unguiculata]|uniref:Uncharacterized protein n=1 Tax=Vigna unguiculata TaxID=3917 RepID=A0A4D6LY16_VIGUN|nr:hypothetical protein DEO72_LG5g1290 [Vigna unguiculata]